MFVYKIKVLCCVVRNKGIRLQNQSIFSLLFSYTLSVSLSLCLSLSHTHTHRVFRESCNNRLKENNHGLFPNEHFTVTCIHVTKRKNKTHTLTHSHTEDEKQNGKRKRCHKNGICTFYHNISVCFPLNSCNMLDRSSILFSRKRSKAYREEIPNQLFFHKLLRS